jgi:uncharacterized membrane protein YfcA
MIPGIEINIFLLVFLGLAVGVVSGFVGVGGGFFMTPALIILGFPANFAVGTSLTWITGNAVIGALRHGKLGNVDIKLGLVITASSMSGMEVGVRILNWAKDIGLTDEIVLSVSIFMLLIVGTYTLSECIRTERYIDDKSTNEKEAPPTRGLSLSQRIQRIGVPPRLHLQKSGVNISLWTILVIGFLVGVLAGFIGVGGGFLMVPSLVYLIGVPSFTAVGTDLFQIIFSAAYGSIRHTMSSNVVIFAALIMLVGSSIGVQFGALVTHYVRGVCMRFVLGIATLIAALGAIFKLIDILLGKITVWLEISSIVITFTGLGLAVFMIIFLFIMATRYRNGKSTPVWVKALMAVKD